MRETFEQQKSEEFIQHQCREPVVLACDACGHRETGWGEAVKACPLCGHPMWESPEFDAEEDERRLH